MLPGLAPHHTRGGFTGGGKLGIEFYATSPEEFPRTESGLWLPPRSVAEKEHLVGIAKVGALADLQVRLGMSDASNVQRTLDILHDTSITSVGCLVGGETSDNAGKTALELARQELGTVSFNSEADMPFLRVCDDGDCYNPRHFDLSFGRFTLQERKVELNPEWYTQLPSGRIKTLWGDNLQSPAKSLEDLIKLQRKCFPFVPKSKSLLTPGATSHIRFHPVTGCWEAWTYYISSRRRTPTLQSDGYGRLYGPTLRKVLDEETGEISFKEVKTQVVAHRITWRKLKKEKLVEGMVLNHLCSYRRCCNPAHLEQVTPQTNILHGIRVQKALGLNEAGQTASADNFLSAEELIPYHEVARAMYLEICKSKGLAA